MKAKYLMTPLSACAKAGDQKAPELITSMGISVAEETSIIKCIDILLKYHVNRLPVLDKSKKVVGVIYIQNVFSNIMMIALVCVLLLALWSMRGVITLGDVDTLIW